MKSIVKRLATAILVAASLLGASGCSDKPVQIFGGEQLKPIPAESRIPASQFIMPHSSEPLCDPTGITGFGCGGRDLYRQVDQAIPSSIGINGRERAGYSRLIDIGVVYTLLSTDQPSQNTKTDLENATAAINGSSTQVQFTCIRESILSWIVNDAKNEAYRTAASKLFEAGIPKLTSFVMQNQHKLPAGMENAYGKVGSDQIKDLKIEFYGKEHDLVPSFATAIDDYRRAWVVNLDKTTAIINTEASTKLATDLLTCKAIDG